MNRPSAVAAIPEPKGLVESTMAATSLPPTHVPSKKPDAVWRTDVPHATIKRGKLIRAIQASGGNAGAAKYSKLQLSLTRPHHMGMDPSAGRASRRSGRTLFELIPDPWRGWIGLRRPRRWVRAVRFARRHNRSLAAKAPAVSFYPMRLEPTAALAHVFARLGVRIVDFGRPADLTVAWETSTWLSERDAGKLPLEALNRGCVDISKSTVDRIWADVCGYSISVDPLSWSGPMVVKPLLNATRGGAFG